MGLTSSPLLVLKHSNSDWIVPLDLLTLQLIDQCQYIYLFINYKTL
jgi:hypothetical protein